MFCIFFKLDSADSGNIKNVLHLVTRRLACVMECFIRFLENFYSLLIFRDLVLLMKKPRIFLVPSRS